MPQINPRFIRHRDAPGYLGMDKNRFNAECRPFQIEIKMGIQGIAFDRVDLDIWADEYKLRNGRQNKSTTGEQLCNAKKRQVLSKEVKSGIYTKPYSDTEFEKVVALTKKQKLS
jgi:hypothetical protein